MNALNVSKRHTNHKKTYLYIQIYIPIICCVPQTHSFATVEKCLFNYYVRSDDDINLVSRQF